jgi:hypothetical protein
MGRDVTFLDDEGFPVEGLTLGEHAHGTLQDAVAKHGLPQLATFTTGYYDDAEVPLDALPAFIGELTMLETSITADRETRRVAAAIRVVAEAALAAGRPLLALAD